MAAFHFLRPEWLYALLLIGLMLLWRRRLSSRTWQGVVDPRLLPYLLVGKDGRRTSSMLAGIAALLAIFAMAGPAWQKLEVPVYRKSSALVVLLDLSRSMDAEDVKPSRLQRAQMKLRDILSQQKEADTALIVFAASPFVVSPLTPDAKTIASQLASLSTDLMPSQGSRPDRAIGRALQLLQQSGTAHGSVLLISDGVDPEAAADLKNAVSALVGAGHCLSVLGVGSAAGAPIPSANGGFLKDAEGAIVLAKLDEAGMAELARQGNGQYRHISTDDSDFHALLATESAASPQQAEGMSSDQWRDEGPWLLLPLLLLGALAFRRGYLLALLLFMLPLPRSAYALDWEQFLMRDDQRAQQAMQANKPELAATLFKNPEWRAAAHYRAGKYQAAAEELQGIDSADADYNRGNALAKMGKLPEAVGAYEAALKRNPDNEDAKFNRDLLKKMITPKNKPQDKQNDKQNDKPNDKPNDKSRDKNANQSNGDKPSGTEKNRQAGKSGAAPSDSGQGEPAQPKQPVQPAQSSAKQTEPPMQKQGAAGEGKSAAETDNPQEKMKPADRQWLGRIQDDPGGLWRRKFLYQYKQNPEKNEDKAW